MAVIPIPEASSTPRVVDSIPSGDSFGPEMGWEFNFAAKHDVLYPIARTGADVVPFVSKLFPSGWKEFKEMSIAGKGVDIGLDALVLLPPRWIGTGIKTLLKPVTWPVGKTVGAVGKAIFPRAFEKEPKPVLDALMSKVRKFEYIDQRSFLSRKFDLEPFEVENLLAGNREVLRGNINLPVSIRPQWKKLWTKEGTLTGEAKSALERSALPPEVLRLQHYKREWEKFAQTVLSKDYKSEDIFQAQVKRLFGEDAKMTFADIGARDFSKVLMDALYNEGRAFKNVDVGLTAYLTPTRKVYMSIKGAMEGIYEPLRIRYGASNQYTYDVIESWKLLMVGKGLMKYTKGGKYRELFTPKEWKAAGIVIDRMSTMQSAKEATSTIKAFLQGQPPVVRKIAETYHDWTNHMYMDYLDNHIRVSFLKDGTPAILNKYSLTPSGELGFRELLQPNAKGLQSLRAAMSIGGNVAYELRYAKINEFLDGLKATAKANPMWFRSGAVPEGLLQDLSLRGKGAARGIPDYLDNYAPRIFDDPLARMRAKQEGVNVPMKMEAGFVKARTLEEHPGASTELHGMIMSRARAQGRELFMFPGLPELNKAVATMPPRMKKFAEHHVSRLMGMTSDTDRRVADFLRKHFSPAWDERRVSDLAYKINDLVYLGGLAFKPFSAMRNYFQVLLNVPADMGGLKNYYWLGKGYWRAATDGAMRAQFREWGVISEYAPDLLFRPVVTKYASRLKLFGKELPFNMQTFRDVGMWLFKGSDQHNRYVTGAAAMEKFEYYLSKFGFKDANDWRLTGRNVDDFIKKLNLRSREPWVAKKIEVLLRDGSPAALQEAKKAWVLDVVADTQYLYGALDAPLISGVGGGVGRTAVVFQSWWMNYGSLLSKWIQRTDSVPATADRLFTFMLSSAAAYHIMRPMWGTRTAASTVFLGPLPIEPDIPASWRPFQDALKLVIESAGVALTISPPEAAVQRFKSMLNSGLIFVPGGLQLKRTIPRLVEGDLAGVAKSLVRYQPPKE